MIQAMIFLANDEDDNFWGFSDDEIKNSEDRPVKLKARPDMPTAKDMEEHYANTK